MRWAVAATAGLAAAASTTSAISQDGSGTPAVPSATAPTPAALQVIVPPPGQDATPIARTLPHDEVVADLNTLVEARSHDLDKIDEDTRCMAKVVHHEAGNQPLRGQLAVAEVIVNRTRSSGRFPSTACAVANQRGQFFQTAAYRIAEDSYRWRTAVAVSRLAQSSAAPHVVPGALFFHASYAHPGWKHKMIAHIGDQIFYQ